MEYSLLNSMFIPFVIELIIGAVILLKHPLRFRYKAPISVIGGLLIPALATTGVILYMHYFVKIEQFDEITNVVSYTIPFVSVYFGMLFAYKVDPLKLILNVTIAYTFQAIAYQLTIIILDTGIQAEIYKNLGEDWYNKYYPIFSESVNLVVKIGLYISLYFTIAKVYRNYSKYILRPRQIIIFGIVVFLIVNVLNVFTYRHLFWDSTMKGLIAGAMVIFCVMFDLYAVGNLRTLKETNESIIIKTTLNSKIRQQEMLDNNIQFINMKCHDLRKQLRNMRDRKQELTDEDFSLLIDSLNFFDSSVKTGNVNIDTLIQDKLIYCNSVDIEFTSLVDGKAFDKLISSDVYFLLTNIIDNAIEATENITNKEKRVISLTASLDKGILIIEESNYFEGKIEVNKDGSIKTTKKDKKYHGYGTKSIAYIVKKYDGQLDISVRDNVFKLRIAI